MGESSFGIFRAERLPDNWELTPVRGPTLRHLDSATARSADSGSFC